ncbi:MAG: Fe3+/spermidine/putrescine ABC transporter ATP-binding protein [Archaeoglobus sp.]|nr:MAG: Fe3+/spermidine/putrescine ABC transporter ATP-binding protein [Archaeoglobus sp.]
MALLEVKNLSIDLGEFHLRNISLTVEKKDYLAVIGPTGSGKSVLLEAIAGFYPTKAGRIILDGRDITTLPPEKRGISIVYQDFMLFPHLNVFDNIAFGLRKITSSKVEIEREVKTIAEKLHIDHIFHRKVSTLSGGEKQRVAIARALVVRPRILLMDEPFSALDEKTRENLRAIVKKAVREYDTIHDTAVVHVTHDFEDVFALANKVVVMNAGKVVQIGTVEDIFCKPTSDFVADFVGTNFVRGKVLESSDITAVRVGNVVIYTTDVAKPGIEVTLSIRPEAIILARELGESSAQNILPARVMKIRKRGHLLWLILDVDGLMLRAVITPNAAELLGIKEGVKLYTMFKASNVRVVG